MILVDVVFPELDRIIDFQLDDEARGWDIAEEIATMAARSFSRRYEADKSSLMLYSMDTRRPLDLNYSLKENGVHSGERLLFV